MAKLVARLLATAALRFRIQTSLKDKKYQMGDLSKGGSTYLARKKKTIHSLSRFNFSNFLPLISRYYPSLSYVAAILIFLIIPCFLL